MPAFLSYKISVPNMPISHKMIPRRMVVYSKDVQNITGRSERTARALLQKIRVLKGKKKGQFVSVAEFCDFTGLQESEVLLFLCG
ncbi:hypothetical protein MKQ70_03085 [Chitinophaga sedimenti]|uniref:hypothetical protein n=1 Tax=Chitinophaga sedimenti TaxID=2033606 RepID=UPI002005036A|nr:hypothetical protein [Chitinophaga sedimenti]MCK7554048.1 hypothetical protein [Chitinophaga sedimenti]